MKNRSKSRFAGIRVGMIGCGKVAHFHAQVLKYLGVKLEAVCGASEHGHAKAFAREHHIPRIYPDALTLLKSEKVDAIWVMASWNTLQDLLSPVMETGIPAFFEKPVALSSRFLEKLMRKQKRHTRKVLLGYNRRFYDFVPKIKSIISRYGVSAVDVHLPEQTDLFRAATKSKHWFLLWLYSSSHVLDFLRYFLGNLKIVSFLRGPKSKGNKASFSYHALLISERYGAPVHINAVWNSPENTSVTIYSKKKRLVVSPLEKLSIFEGMRLRAIGKNRKIRAFEPILIEKQEVDRNFKPGFLKQAENFLNTLVLKRKQNKIGSTLEDALAVTRLCERLSGRTN